MAMFLAALTLCGPIWAHRDLEEQIEVLDKLIEAKPEDAQLYLRRGELHRLHRDWKRAEADYLTARKLDKDLATVDFCLGRMNLEAGKPGEARQHLDRFLKARPNDSMGHATRARALEQLGHHLAAAEDFTLALARLPEDSHKPEYYLERARSLVAAGPEHRKRALAGLDEGLEKLGEPVTLQLYAVDLELELKRYDAALTRIDSMAAHSTRQEPWLMRKGAVLEAAGRRVEALRMYKEALSAVRSLPENRRKTRAAQRLENEAVAAVERLEAGRSVVSE